MDFVLLGYLPDVVTFVISASDDQSKPNAEDYELSRMMNNNHSLVDNTYLNEICY
jgi:hypothetical protein